MRLDLALMIEAVATGAGEVAVDSVVAGGQEDIDSEAAGSYSQLPPLYLALERYQALHLDSSRLLFTLFPFRIPQLSNHLSVNHPGNFWYRFTASFRCNGDLVGDSQLSRG